jgi:hypothetical protein
MRWLSPGGKGIVRKRSSASAMRFPAEAMLAFVAV